MKPVLAALGWALVLACGSAAPASETPLFNCMSHLAQKYRTPPATLIEDRKLVVLEEVSATNGDPQTCEADPATCAGRPKDCEEFARSLSYWEYTGHFEDDRYPVDIEELKKKAESRHNDQCKGVNQTAFAQGFLQGISGQRTMPGTTVLSKANNEAAHPKLSAYLKERQGCGSYSNDANAYSCCVTGGKEGFTELIQYLGAHLNPIPEGTRLGNCQQDFQLGVRAANEYCDRAPPESSNSCSPPSHKQIRYLGCYHAGFAFQFNDRLKSGGPGCQGIKGSEAWFEKVPMAVDSSTRRKPTPPADSEERAGSPTQAGEANTP